MRLYVVTDRATAEALRANRPLLHAESLILDDITEGTVRVPALVFYRFPRLADLTEEFPDDVWDQWEEVAIDVSDDVARLYECPCPEGGNSTWRLPREMVARLLAQVARPPEPGG